MPFLALLFAVALAVKYWWFIAAIVGLMVAAYWTRRAVERHAERVEVERRRLADLVAHADQQHNWTMRGDPRGTFGEFPATEFPAAPT
jgi:uncharacterized membrane protein